MTMMNEYKTVNKYAKDDLVFIVYNNRSLSNVVNNFIPKYTISEMLLFNRINELFQKTLSLFPEIEMGLVVNDFDIDAIDFKITPDDIKSKTQLLLDAHENLNGVEYDYLKNRGITDEIIDLGKLGSMSYITKQEDLDILGVSTHPIMHRMFDGGTLGGGISIPLFNKDGILENASFRKISDYNKLKYCHSCPDIFVWGVDDINPGDTVWLVEGVFDKYTLDTILPDGVKAIATSSASISPIQYMKIISKRPGKINIICDNDKVGFKMGFVAQHMFKMNRILCNTYYFEDDKDVSEHILQNNGTLYDLEPVNITMDLIMSKGTEYEERIPLNFCNYLKNRTF